MQNPASAPIVLASSSSYRRGLLDRFLDDYETVSPNVDETDDGTELPEHFAARLAREKAEAVSSGHRDALIMAMPYSAARTSRNRHEPVNMASP